MAVRDLDLVIRPYFDSIAGGGQAVNESSLFIYTSCCAVLYEPMAFHPCRLGLGKEERFLPIEQTTLKLQHPLKTTVTHLDTDERVPEERVPPILVEEF